jgi:hypothetical protein
MVGDVFGMNALHDLGRIRIELSLGQARDAAITLEFKHTTNDKLKMRRFGVVRNLRNHRLTPYFLAVINYGESTRKDT